MNRKLFLFSNLLKMFMRLSKTTSILKEQINYIQLNHQVELNILNFFRCCILIDYVVHQIDDGFRVSFPFNLSSNCCGRIFNHENLLRRTFSHEFTQIPLSLFKISLLKNIFIYLFSQREMERKRERERGREVYFLYLSVH